MESKLIFPLLNVQVHNTVYQELCREYSFIPNKKKNLTETITLTLADHNLIKNRSLDIAENSRSQRPKKKKN